MKKDFFNPQNIKRINCINEKLLAEEIRISSFIKKLKHFHEDLIKKNAIDDLNYDYQICLFTCNEKINKKFNAEVGDPITTINIWCPEVFTEEDSMLEDWNETPPSHPLNELKFCYTMHILVFDTHILSWEDIIELDDIWLEIKIDYQFFAEMDASNSNELI